MLVAFGEAMIRLSPPGFQRFEQATSFEIRVGGAELNTAAGFVRFGHEASWISALPDTPLGHLVLGRARETGVDVSGVSLVEDGRCGLYFLEHGAAPRPGSVVYDRTSTAIAAAVPGSSGFWGGWKPGTFDWKVIFDGATWFHTSGIAPALSSSCAAVVREALQAARQAGVHTSFDLNYRSKLWSAEKAGSVLSGLLEFVDVLFAGASDARTLFDSNASDFGEAAMQFRAKFGCRSVATIERDATGVWKERLRGLGYADDTLFETAWHDIEVVDRVGAGDAFAAGVLHGLESGDFGHGIDCGAAAAALQHTVPGDLPGYTKDDVAAVLEGQGLRLKR